MLMLVCRTVEVLVYVTVCSGSVGGGDCWPGIRYSVLVGLISRYGPVSVTAVCVVVVGSSVWALCAAVAGSYEPLILVCCLVRLASDMIVSCEVPGSVSFDRLYGSDVASGETVMVRELVLGANRASDMTALATSLGGSGMWSRLSLCCGPLKFPTCSFDGEMSTGKIVWCVSVVRLGMLWSPMAIVCEY